MLTYEEALDYLYSFVDYGAVRAAKYSPDTFDLGRFVDFMAALGNPHQGYPIVHVAGTKGKGSVAALMAGAITAGGYRTGLYTSPHLNDFRERIRVSGEMIGPETAAALVADMQPVVARIPGLTTFELSTALAFVHFQRVNVDVAVLEVGLGGRLDATNVVAPRVTVITSLSYDHMYLLGNTLGEIAAEKAGIIKRGVPVVSAPQACEALEVVERIAAERGAPLTLVGRDWLFEAAGHTLDGQTLKVWSAREGAQVGALRAAGHSADWQPTRLEIPLLGQHQVENAVVAYAALNTLRDEGVPLAARAIAEGMRAVHWPGRFEVVLRRPFVVLDGAHNRDSAQKLAKTLAEYFPGRRVVLLFGASSDKDVSGMFDELLRPEVDVAHVIVTQAVHPRAQDPDALLAQVRGHGVTAEARPSVAQALGHALQWASQEDVIAVCGSLFVVAEARAAAARQRELEC